MPPHLTMADYVSMRDQYHGPSTRTKFRKLVGPHDPTRGTLENLNEQVAAYLADAQPGRLVSVHDAIEEISCTPDVEKYGPFLADLVIRLPPRPISKNLIGSVARPGGGARAAGVQLVRAMIEAQRESAYRIFVEGSYADGMDRQRTPPTVAWKMGAVASTKMMLKSWTGMISNYFEERAKASRERVWATLSATARDQALLQQMGRKAIQDRARHKAMLKAIGRKAPIGDHAPSRSADHISSLARRAPRGLVDVADGTPDMWELGAAGAAGFRAGEGFSVHDIGSGELTSRLKIFTDGSNTGLDEETVNYFVSAIGLAFSCLAVVSGCADEIRAAFVGYHAHELKSAYRVVPFGNASAAVTGVRELLKREAKELAAMGAANIGGGASSLAGLGPLGGVAAMGVKLLIRVALSLRDAEEVVKARKYLQCGELWKDPLFVTKAMADVPLFAAYYIRSANTSDLVGFLSNPQAFSINTFKADVQKVGSQLTFLRDMANSCQMHATWGFESMTGWMQCLDSRWYKQAPKEAFNCVQEFKRADTDAMSRRVDGLNMNKFLPKFLRDRREQKAPTAPPKSRVNYGAAGPTT